MTASLPPIPEEAVEAVLRWWYPNGSAGRSTQFAKDEAQDELAAAWPVIVPAILRWVADRIDRDCALARPEDGSDDCRCAAASAWLRSLADEMEGQ